MKALNYANAAKFLYDFEHERFEALKEIHFHGYNAWHLLKSSIYFNAIYPPRSIGELTPKESKIKKIFFYLLELPKLIICIIRLFFKAKKKNFTLFFSLCINKRKNPHSNKYYDILFDSFIAEKHITNYGYIEIPHLNNFKDPSHIKRDCSARFLFFLSSCFTFVIKKRKKTKCVALSIKKELDIYCRQQGVVIDINVSNLIVFLARFRSEYIVFNLFFRIIKPHLVFFTDQSATGKMAAALSSGAKVLELQHGLMDEYYPHYTHSPLFKTIKKHLINPTKIVLFGEYYKDVLLKKNYKDESEFFIVGSFPMHLQRIQKTTSVNSNDGIIKLFLPTQGRLIFEKTKRLLQTIEDCFNDQIHLIIKPHPNETEENKEWFRLYCNKEYFRFNDSNKSIMDFIEESTIVMGFDSTTLLEAVGLGKPAITITSPELPKGVHSLINTTILEDSIKICSPTREAISDLLEKYKENPVFKEKWLYAIKTHATYVYANNYVDNCKYLIKTILE